jgi:prophage regulatory protein
VGLSRSSIYDLVAKGQFPAQHKLTAHAVGWRVGEIRQWLRREDV